MKRNAFTILELLIVVFIILLMMSIMLGVSMNYIGRAKIRATQATVEKVGSVIDDRVSAFRAFDFSDIAERAAQPLSVISGSAVTASVSEVYIRKIQFKLAFPQTFLELNDSQKQQLFGRSNLPPTLASDPDYQSRFEPGIVLYAILFYGPTFGSATPLEGMLSASEVKNDATTGHMPCLVDSWGEPLRFYRWPTRLLRCGENMLGDYNNNGSDNDPAGSVNLATGTLQASPPIRPIAALPGPTPVSLLIANLPGFDPANPLYFGLDGQPGYAAGTAMERTAGWPDSDDVEPLNRDADDPMMLLTGLLTSPTLLRGYVVGRTLDPTGAFLMDAFHDPYTFSVPLVVSAGPDRKLGLYEPTDIPTKSYTQSQNFGYLAAPMTGLSDLFDNLTNRNRRSK